MNDVDHRLTFLEQTFKESFEFIKEHMATKVDLQELKEDLSKELRTAWKIDVASAKYEIIDAVDRKFENRDHQIRTIKSTITSFHPTAFTK